MSYNQTTLHNNSPNYSFDSAYTSNLKVAELKMFSTLVKPNNKYKQLTEQLESYEVVNNLAYNSDFLQLILRENGFKNYKVVKKPSKRSTYYSNSPNNRKMIAAKKPFQSFLEQNRLFQKIYEDSTNSISNLISLQDKTQNNVSQNTQFMMAQDLQ